jgi:perosamine synthetase
VEFHHTHISPGAIALAEKVLRSGRLSEGPVVRQFESAIQDQLGMRGPVALNSGTAALHLALAIAGVGPGDEVILPAQTFVATGLAVLMQRAEPVFADIDPSTGNISIESIKRRLTPRSRAILPVHWGGRPCDLDEINALAGERGLAVIEDAAHALGASYRGRPVGSISRFTAFSLQAIKHLTTGDGGVLCCLDPADEEQARKRRWFGIDRERSEPSILGERLYDIDAIGFKYHMNDLAAALGLGNLETLAARLKRRRDIGAHYNRELSGVPGLTLLRQESDRDHAYWLFTVRVERREEFVRRLAASSVPVSVVHLGIDHNAVFGGARGDLPGQAEFNRTQVSLPVHEGLDDEDVATVVRAVRSGW